MADLTGFRQMLADRADADKGLPQVCLKCSSDFDMALAKLISVDNRQDDETDSQVAARYVDEICEALGKPENAGVVEAIGGVIAAFKEKICAAKNSLTEIRAHARELAGYMETFKTDALARDPFVASHLNLTKLSEDYPTWDWAGPKLIGASTYIKERVGTLLVAKDADIPEDFDYRLYLMACSTIASKVTLEEVTLAEDIKTTLVDTLAETLSDLSKESIAEVVDILTGAKTIRGLMLDLQRLPSMPPSELFNRIKEYDGLIQKYYPVAEAIHEKKVELPEGSEALLDNSQRLMTLCEFLAYYELMERETVFRQSILLQGGLLNADEKSAYEQAGGTNLMIAHYIRYMYKDDVTKIPARGISSKVIIESAAHNEKVVKADIGNITNRIAIATTSARVAAFNTVAHRYIVNKVDRERPDDTPASKTVFISRYMEGVVKKIANRILHHDICFVDAGLMLIVEADYSGTFVEQMYNELGAAYLAKAQDAEDGTVSDLDLQVAEMSVVARMVSNFVVEHLVECCVCKDMTVKSPIVPAQNA